MPAEEKTHRRLSTVHVYAISTGAMFSSGFFLLPGLAVGETGASVPIAYLIAGLLVTPAMLSTAELATAFPRAGGPYHFFQRSLGPQVAVIGALGLFVAMILKAAFALVGIGAYLTIVVDLPAEPVAAGLAVAFTGLNLVGARESARLQVGLVTVLLLVLGVFVAFGVVETAERGMDEAADAFSPLLGEGATGLLAATGLVFVSYAGLLQVASIAGSVREPSRTIPRGLLASLATATTIYVAGTALMVTVLPMDELTDDTTPVATAVEAMAFPWGVGLVVVAAVAAFASTGNAGIMSASRYPLALARDGLLVRRFARLGHFRTPTLSVVVTGAVTTGLILTLDVERIAKLASAFLLLVFALLNLAVIVLRNGRVTGYRPEFRLPLHPWVETVGIVAAVVLVIDLGLMPALFGLAIVVGGLLWYLAVGPGEAGAESTVIELLHRLHAGPVDEETLRRLQEQGPSADDHAGDVLDDAAFVVVDQDADMDRVIDESAVQLAATLGVSPDEARRWVTGPEHLTVDLDPGRTRLHHLVLDHARGPEVVVAWAPTDGSGNHRRGPTAAVVAGPALGPGPSLRIAALVATQLSDPQLEQRWSRSEDPDTVRDMLVTDAVARQGGEPPR